MVIFGLFAVFPDVGVNGARKRNYFFSVSVQKRLIWRVNRVATIRQDRPEIMARRPPCPGPAIQTLIATKDMSDFASTPSPPRCA